MTAFLMFLGLLSLVMINVPIAVSLGVVAMAAMVVHGGMDSLLSAAITMFSGATSFPLLAIPLFILAGAIMNSSSLSRRLIAFASACFGFIKGGLAMVNIGTSLFFAEISGSAVADVAAMGSILIPAMKKKGYPKEFAAAVTSSSATLAIIIPPSIPMILYAVMAEASVVQIFVAGIVPGILGGGGMMALAYWYAKRYNYPVEEVFSWAKFRSTFKDAAWAFMLPMIILGGIFGGVVTATEGAALAVLAALFDNSEGFPRGKPLQVATAQPGDGKAVVQFVGLPEGDYAVSVFLDENGNMKLDANVFGVPTELYGFSRNARSALGPPQFADAAFRVGADVSPQAIELK